MMMSWRMPSPVMFTGALILVLLSSCGEEQSKKSDTQKGKSNAREEGVLHAKRTALDQPKSGVDRELEEFTGNHTRIVWTEFQRLNDADTFADGEEHLLKGIDTRDGKGERMIQDRLDNYARPMISTDGNVIIFSNKKVTGEKGARQFDCHVFRTDWQGSKPVRLTEGYATDCWKDPATGVEWIYVARGFRGGKRPSLDADRVVRVRLDDPRVEEPVYVDGRISPDNLQLSRDGKLASGVFPWPNCGVLVRREDGTYDATKLMTGCWPSMAPDNSGVSWVFDGSHRGAVFFTADGERTWQVNFNHGAGMDGYELYHPRWSNHPRFMAITGPYVAGKTPGGNMIRKGGASAQVYLGRFSGNLDRVEAWLQVTHDELSESYPDVWIAGGNEHSLAAFHKDAPSTVPEIEAAKGWPVIRDRIVFVWWNRNATNHFKGRDGKVHDSAEVVARGAALFGRHHEMRAGDGHFEASLDAAAYAIEAMKSASAVTLELALLPGPTQPGQQTGLRSLFRGPGLMAAMDSEGHLICGQGSASFRSSEAIPPPPVHLAVIRREDGFEAFANGKAMPLGPEASESTPALESLQFGGGSGLGMMGVSIHDRALTAAELERQSEAQHIRIARLPPPAPTVRLNARLVQVSALPTAEGIAPYQSALVAYVYEAGENAPEELRNSRFIVKHWAMLDQRLVQGFPRETGKSYDLYLERESDHLHIKGERLVDETTSFELEAWLDVSEPRLAPQ